MLILLAFVLNLPIQSDANELNGPQDDIFLLPLEDLMQQQVSTLTKKLQKIEDTSAAAYIISAQDIARSGATSLPEVLRLAPGVNVATINNNRWAVSIRGFNSRLSDKLLVLLDGRTIYPSLFPGTVWENNDIPLELIERVEILRGSAAAAWGNNAVNGVINIISKSSHDMIGGQLGVVVGTEQQASGTAIHSWALDENTSFRVHAYGQKTGKSERVSGGTAPDGWESQNIGFRLDKELNQGRILLQGGAFSSLVEDEIIAPRFDGGVDVLTDDRKHDSAHLQLMWEHFSSNGTSHTFQGFTEFSESDFAGGSHRRKTLDLEYQQQLTLGNKHDLIWGLAYRLWNDGGPETPYAKLISDYKTSHLASVFAQDDISLIAEKLVLSVGARLEQRSDIDKEFQPNIRLLWTPNRLNSVWLAATRAARMTVRTEREAIVTLVPPSTETFMLPVVTISNEDLQSEIVKSVDFGWRRQWYPSLSTDLAGFVNHYDNLRSTQLSMPTSFPPTAIPLLVGNGISAESYGAELSVDWAPRNDWQFTLNYSWLHVESSKDDPAVVDATFDNSSPKNTLALHVSHQFNPKFEWSGSWRYVDDIDIVSPTHGFGGAYHVPSYTTLDLKLKYQLDPNVSLSVVGQNLLQSSHKEFIDDLSITPATEIQRGMYLKIDWRH